MASIRDVAIKAGVGIGTVSRALNGSGYISDETKQKIMQAVEELTMKYICDVCGWEYDEEKGYPEGGIAPGTKWEDVPDDFECPLCSVGKDQFSAEE